MLLIVDGKYTIYYKWLINSLVLIDYIFVSPLIRLIVVSPLTAVLR